MQVFYSLNSGKVSDTILADLLAAVIRQASGRTAENTVRFMLTEDDLVTVQMNFQFVAFSNIQGSTKFNGKYDTAQLIHFSDDTCRFHINRPPLRLILLFDYNYFQPLCQLFFDKKFPYDFRATYPVPRIILTQRRDIQ